jgi:hypothetical protein
VVDRKPFSQYVLDPAALIGTTTVSPNMIRPDASYSFILL